MTETIIKIEHYEGNSLGNFHTTRLTAWAVQHIPGFSLDGPSEPVSQVQRLFIEIPSIGDYVDVEVPWGDTYRCINLGPSGMGRTILGNRRELGSRNTLRIDINSIRRNFMSMNEARRRG